MISEITHNINRLPFVKKLKKRSHVYLVGGCVRDAYMGNEPKDIDLLIEGMSTDDIISLLEAEGKVDVVGKSFSVIKFTYRGETYDIAVPRKDRKIGDGHKGFEVITDNVSVGEDLKRRDFTINAIAVNLNKISLIDPFGGTFDIEMKRIKAVDSKAFIEDPLRILRGIQFASRFDFDIEDETLDLMKKHSHLVSEISGERILDELNKIVNKGNCAHAYELIFKTDIDRVLFGQKMFFETLSYRYDPASFYHTLASYGNVDPYTFYKDTLRGDTHVAKNIKALDDFMNKWYDTGLEEQKRYLLFQLSVKYPIAFTADVMPRETERIVKMMKAKEIPMDTLDLHFTGDDIINMKQVDGKKVGEIKETMIKDALMNRYDWQSREKTLYYLESLFYLEDL
jgi:tRNA nucleotidyltransferase/poly(A) polymerase